MRRETTRLAIIGGGPAGISAAIEARKAGLKKMILLEREQEAGGAPRHCGHKGFGMRDFHRLWTGPEYARHLREASRELDVRCGHAVTHIASGGIVGVSGREGLYEIAAERILVATGVFEKPYTARLLSGGHPGGIYTTGALQRFVYINGGLPCKSPVVVGSNLTAYSAILTLRHAGARPVALIQSAPKPASTRLAAAAAQFVFGVPTFTDTRVVSVEGEERVRGINIENRREKLTIPCDGIIFSGEWVAESALLRGLNNCLHSVSTLQNAIAPFRTLDPCVLAVGNVVGLVRSSGSCGMEGRKAARMILADLAHGPQRL